MNPRVETANPIGDARYTRFRFIWSSSFRYTFRMERRPQTHLAPSRSEAYQKALTSALVAAVLALMTLKFLLGIAFMAAAVVAVVSFLIFFGLFMRMTPRGREE